MSKVKCTLRSSQSATMRCHSFAPQTDKQRAHLDHLSPQHRSVNPNGLTQCQASSAYNANASCPQGLLDKDIHLSARIVLELLKMTRIPNVYVVLSCAKHYICPFHLIPTEPKVMFISLELRS